MSQNQVVLMSDDDYNSTIMFVGECIDRFRQAFFDSNQTAMLAAMVMLNSGTATILQSMGSPSTEASDSE